MKSGKVWKFIGTNVVSLTTVLLGVVVLLLDGLNVIPDSVLSSTVLALLVLLATSELVESRRRLSELDGRLEDISSQLANTIGIEVKTFSSHDEAIEYITRRTLEASHSIDHAAIDYKRSRQTPARLRYEKIREKTILSDRVKYRYLGVLYSKRRLEFGRRFILEKKTSKFYAGYYLKPYPEIPFPFFMVFDKRETVTRYPFEPGQDAGYMSIRSPEVADLFLGYFERLWESSQMLQTEEDYVRLAERVTD
jgi:hypothetical protein